MSESFLQFTKHAKSSNNTRGDEFFREVAKIDIPNIPFLVESLLEYVPASQRAALVKEYEELRGNAKLSPKGKFGAWSIIHADMVGDTEKAWTQQVSEFCDHVLTALTGEPAHNKNLPKTTLRKNVPMTAYVLIHQLTGIMNDIDDVFPTESNQGIER
jgi:hypothetical protein